MSAEEVRADHGPGVQEDQDVRSGEPGAPVAGLGDPESPVLLERVGEVQPVLEGFHHFRGRVGGAVVDDDDFELVGIQVLSGEPAECLGQERGPVERGDDD